MNSSARGNRVPVAAPSRSKQESLSTSRVNHAAIPVRGCFRSRVTIMQQIDCNPQFGLRESISPLRVKLFLLEFRNLMREPRHFSARRIAMHDALLCRADQSRFGFRHGRSCEAAIAGGKTDLACACMNDSVTHRQAGSSLVPRSGSSSWQPCRQIGSQCVAILTIRAQKWARPPHWWRRGTLRG